VAEFDGLRPECANATFGETGMDSRN
jgi:hypothetical protein